MQQFSNLPRNSIINFHLFLYLVACFLRVTVLLLCRSHGRTMPSPFTNKTWINWKCTFDTACNRHSNETLTLRKHVTKYRNMRKWMIEFFKKFDNFGIKIARVNSILISKTINLQLFILILFGAGVRCDRRRFSVLSPFIEKSMLKAHN